MNNLPDKFWTGRRILKFFIGAGLIIVGIILFLFFHSGNSVNFLNLIFAVTLTVLGVFVIFARPVSDVDNQKLARRLVIQAWVGSLAALPLIIWVLLDAMFSEGSPQWSHPLLEFLLLITGPIVALSALLKLSIRCRLTPARLAAIIIPGALGIAEIVYIIELIVPYEFLMKILRLHPQ
jgi:hypothetical protein